MAYIKEWNIPLKPKFHSLVKQDFHFGLIHKVALQLLILKLAVIGKEKKHSFKVRFVNWKYFTLALCLWFLSHSYPVPSSFHNTGSEGAIKITLRRARTSISQIQKKVPHHFLYLCSPKDSEDILMIGTFSPRPYDPIIQFPTLIFTALWVCHSWLPCMHTAHVLSTSWDYEAIWLV